MCICTINGDGCDIRRNPFHDTQIFDAQLSRAVSIGCVWSFVWIAKIFQTYAFGGWIRLDIFGGPEDSVGFAH